MDETGRACDAARAAANVVVRAAAEEDIARIADILNWAIVNTAANFHTEPLSADQIAEEWREGQAAYPWVVAEVGGVVAGFAHGSRFHSRCAYAHTAEVSVYVDPGHQGRGVGRALYGVLIPALDARGFHTLVAAIALPNPASVRLHEAFGFVHAGTLRQVGRKFGRWHDVGYWQRLCIPEGGHS